MANEVFVAADRPAEPIVRGVVRSDAFVESSAPEHCREFGPVGGVGAVVRPLSGGELIEVVDSFFQCGHRAVDGSTEVVSLLLHFLVSVEKSK